MHSLLDSALEGSDMRFFMPRVDIVHSLLDSALEGSDMRIFMPRVDLDLL